MRTTVRSAAPRGPVRSTHRRAKWVVRKRVRLGVIALMLSLLVASMPVSAGRARGVRNTSGAASASLPATVYSSLRKTLGSLSGWLASYVNVKPERNSYQPVTVYFMSPPPYINAPTDLTVTATTSGSVSLSWSGVGGADHYEVERSSSLNGPFFFRANTASTTYGDNSVSSQQAYLYRVRAITSTGVPSAPSNMALGTAISFEFSSLTNQLIKAQHFYDVRTAINAVRGVAGLNEMSWARGTLGGLEVKADDVNELRSALDAGLTALSIPVLAYTDATLATGANGTLIKAVHIEQLQTRATRGSSTSSGPLDSDSTSARLDPLNGTGGGGENPLSRNFNWSLPLVSLPGRTGLDLGLSLSYNSLVWNKVGTSSIWFDEDNGFPGPGFRLGFPVLQSPYYNAEVGKNAFLLIGSDGGRTELRQVGTTALYEAGDSSHLLLDTDTMILRTTAGTQMSYELYGGEYKCTQIKDRNGNYITISYTQSGALTTITDTLARVITFNYDGQGWLTSITQEWNQSGTPVTHNWARFEYSNTPIDTNFQGLTVFGPADGMNVKNLSRVKLADDSYFDFSYTSWGQIWKVKSYAPDTHLVNYRSYNLPQTAGAGLEHDDCPRFTERRDWAQYWNGDTDGTTATNEETLTQFAVPVGVSWTMPDTTTKSGMRAQVTAPDNTSSKIYFIGTAGSATGWQRGLPALVDSYDSSENLKRQVMTTWTQDDTEISYKLNPRISETNTYDPAGNRARTEITYQQFTFANGTSCRLPQDVRQYAANASTILRTRRTVYNTSTTYSNKRILGMVDETRLYEGDANGTLMSRVGYFYDENDSIAGADEPVQHDNINYGAGFVIGRANLSSVKRYDVTSSSFTSTSSKYNTAGAVVSSKNELGYESAISYADSFSDGNNTRNTLAYPTTITDPDEYSSTAQYNFDFGAVTYTRSPQPGVTTNTPGPEQSITFDVIGRVQQNTNLVNNAYTRFEYSITGLRVDTYTTLQENAGESRSFQITDGHGRVVGAATDHPDSSGGYSGRRFVYDVMGQAIKVSNPTETSASGAPSQWNTAGDDAAAGWVYSEQTYDWKGRPLVTTNQDLTTRTVSYTGCGCAGGEVVTVTDEGVIDATGATKKQQQKTYADVLGRIVKSEILTWQSGDAYSTTVNSYNVRDQLRQMRTYAGTESSSTYQQTNIAYDGYGRVQSKHLPEQNDNTSTQWTYNADDTINVITDPRGATSTFEYDNKRKLVTKATYELTGSPTIELSYTHDSVGNVLTMNDPSGSTEYTYTALSQVSSETREFTGLSGQSFVMSYAYNLAGVLKTFTLPAQFGTTVNYQFDRRSRLTGVTNTGYTYSDPTIIEQAVELPMATFLSNITYRAWNVMKSMDNGQGTHLEYDYNSRLSPESYSMSNLTGGSMTWDFDYHPNGRIKLASDNANNHFDRKYEYDHVGRLSEAYTGNEARGGSASTPPNSPYRHTNTYDVFGNLQQQTGRIWQIPLSGQSFSYTNNRRQGLEYDAAGHVIEDLQGSHVFDAQGQRSKVTTGTVGGGNTGNPEMPAQETATTYDGRGNPAIVTSTSREETLVGQGPQTTINPWSDSVYYLRSMVLGAVIAQLNGQGVRTEEFVYAGGERIAQWHVNQWNDSIEWQHKNPLTGTWISVWAGFGDAIRTEVDPTGRITGNQAFFIPPDPPPPPPSRETFFVIEGGPSINAELGMQMYEDRYINRVFEGGGGPGQITEGEFWANWQREREWQLQTGARFLFGIDQMNANVPGATWERVEETIEVDGGYVMTQDKDGTLFPMPTMISRDTSYYRLIPGEQGTKNTGIEFLRDPSGGSYNPGKEDSISAIVNKMRSEACTKIFEEARLTSPSKLLEKGVVIGPATLLSNSSAENLRYMGITEYARNRDAGVVGSNWTKAITIRDHPGKIPDTVDGRPRIFLNTSAFENLGDYLRHEFIHAGGATAKGGGLFTTDLAYFGFKEVRVKMGPDWGTRWEKTGPTEAEIINACR